MAKGCYTVDENPRPRQDTSYRSFICVLLIFLCLCLIVLLASINWSHVSQPNFEKSGNNDRYTGEDLTEKVPPRGTNEKLKNYDTTNHILISRILETTTVSSKLKEGTTAKSEENVDNEMFSNLPTRVTVVETTTLSSQVSKSDRNIFTNILETTDRISTLTSKETDKGKVLVTETSLPSSESEKLSTTLQSTETFSYNLNISTSTTFEESTLAETTVGSFENTFGTFNNSFTTQEQTSSTVINDLASEETAQETTVDFSKLPTLSKSATFGNSFTVTTEEQTFSTATNDLTLKETSTEATVESSSITTLYKSTFNNIFTDTTEEQTSSPNWTTIPSVEDLQVTTQSSENVTINISVHPPTSNESKENVTEPVITELSMSESKSDAQHCPTTIPTLQLCATPVCKTTAARILSMMNHSVEPCDDFYEYACGQFYETDQESGEFADSRVMDRLRDGFTASSRPVQIFKNFYKTCVEADEHFNFTQRIIGLEQLVDEVGRFDFSDNEDIDLTHLFSELLLRQSMPLFDIGLDVDKQTSEFILQLNLPGQSFLRTGLENWSGLSLIKKKCLEKQKSELRGAFINLNDIYKLYENCNADYSAYIGSVDSTLRELKMFKNLSAKSLPNEITNIRFSIEFEVFNKLDALPSSATIMNDFVNKNYEMKRISDLQKQFPFLEWKRLFQTITKLQIEDSTLVQLYFSDYFENMFKDCAKVSKRKLNNALLAIYAHDLFLNTVLPKRTPNPQRFCTDLSKKLLPDVWSYLVHEIFPTSVYENRLKNLFEELKRHFCKSLFDSDWIDEDDLKTSFQRKCQALNLVLFTDPNTFSQLEKNYENLSTSLSYQSNLVNHIINYKRMIFGNVGKIPSQDIIFSYFLDPLGKEPVTFYATPIIAVPLGLVNNKAASLPDSLDFLYKIRVGFGLAKQLARHFDPQGITYKLNLTSTSKSSYSEFVSTMRSLMDYSSPRMFLNKNVTFNLTGSLSINERIVDNTAFRLVLDLIGLSKHANLLPWFSLHYSWEKVFFIASAQEFCKKTSMLDFMLQVFEQRHLPAVLRVENIIGNSERFSELFACPYGSGMDFAEKVQFPYLRVDNEYDEGQLADGI